MPSTFPSPHAAAIQWALQTFAVSRRVLPEPLPSNLTAAVGNTYKNMYEATTMNSGLSVVVLINIVTAGLGVLFYRYIVLRHSGGLLTPDEVQLLRKYPSVRSAQRYTPTDAFVRGAPPMRWTGWPNFFTAGDSALSKDAQVYLLFQRACILTTAICAFFATLFLLPSYWLGGAVFKTDAQKAPHSLLSLLKSDRGVFERFTSHNLPPDSPLVLLQIPVFIVTALCIIVMYTVVKAAAGEERSVSEWLDSGSSTSQPNITTRPSDGARTPRLSAKASATPRSPAAGRRYWTLFARGLPQDMTSADELVEMLEAIYPGQVANVELVCRGRMSEARLLRALSSARNRLDYLYETTEDEAFDHHLASPTLVERIFGLFARRRTRAELIQSLEEKIQSLKRDVESRKVDPVRDFLGCAFISFSSAAAAGSALRDFPVRIGSNASLPGSASSMSSLLREGVVADLTIGRHIRVSSDWGFPGLWSLYKGTVNLLPYHLRERIIQSPMLAPSHVREEHRLHQRLLGICEGRETMSAEVATSRLRNMKAERAPKSGDIIWRNIGISFFERTVREMIVQVLVFTFLILFTSPVAMLTALKLVFAEVALLSDPSMIFGSAGHHNSTFSGARPNDTDVLAFFNLEANGGNAVDSISKSIMDLLPPFLTSNTFLRGALLAYLPVLMLAIVFALVPSILRLTCALEGYPTNSAQEMSVFRKTSFYYVMNSVVLPSLALNTASEFLEMVYKQSDGGANVYNALPILQRLFSGDIAFFLCNYLVQLALTGSVLWLLRVPSSFSMMIRRRMALTPLEAAEAKCTDIFDYPRHYAYGVTVMSMCLLFGFMAPLIWWFALMYFVCKHLVDIYTIRYVHPRTHIDGRLPRLSSNFIVTWTVVSQLSLAVIFYLQGWVRAGIITAILCFLTLACCLSVNAHVGNRIMRYIASLRDKAIKRAMRLGGERYEWILSPPLASSSSASSSTISLTESSETNMLLQNQSLVSEVNAVDDFGNKLWSESIDMDIEGPEKARKEPPEPGSVPEGDKRPRTLDYNVRPEEDSDTDIETNVIGEDLEDGRSRGVLRYGSIENVPPSNKSPR